MAKKQRSPERATKVIERAARMKKFKPGILDRRLFDSQVRTANHTTKHPFYAGLDRRQLQPAGQMDVPIKDIRTPQQTVSLAKVKAKIASGATKPVEVVRAGGKLFLDDGNHTLMAARARGETTIRANVRDIPKAAPRSAPATPAPAAATGAVASAANTYRAMSPYLQAAGVVAAASTAYNAARDSNATRSEAISVAAKAAAPGAALMAAAPIVARFAPSVASGLSKVNPIVFGGAMAYSVAKGAWDGYHAEQPRSTWDRVTGKPAEKGGWKGAAKGAAFGAADTLTFGLASYVAGRNRPAFEQSGNRWQRSSSMSTPDKQSFAAADQKFERASAERSKGTAKPGYKDTWSDSRGRQYTRRNMDVRTRMNEAT